MTGELSHCREVWKNLGTLLCVLQQDKTLRMGRVMRTVLWTVNLVRARGLSRCQFYGTLGNKEITRGMPDHTDVRRLSQGALDLWQKHLFVVSVDWLNVETLKNVVEIISGCSLSVLQMDGSLIFSESPLSECGIIQWLCNRLAELSSH